MESTGLHLNRRLEELVTGIADRAFEDKQPGTPGAEGEVNTGAEGKR